MTLSERTDELLKTESPEVCQVLRMWRIHANAAGAEIDKLTDSLAVVPPADGKCLATWSEAGRFRCERAFGHTANNHIAHDGDRELIWRVDVRPDPPTCRT